MALLTKIRNKIVHLFFQKMRIIFYSLISSKRIGINKQQPLLIKGKGKIIIGKNVTYGVNSSPYFYSGYGYFEPRRKDSYIEIGDNTVINNNAVIISDGKKIIIGKNCLIGTNLEILDSDFHELDPKNRFGGKNIKKKDVIIEENVFIGNNVTILKGVNIGNNCVIGSGSVVTKSFPNNTIIGGNPAEIIGTL